MRIFAGILFILAAACSGTPYHPAVADPVLVDPDYPPAIVELGVDSHGARMNGHLYLANGPGPHPTAVMLHGFPGNEKNLDLAQAIRRAGWNTLFFHYRGAWGSEGTFTFNGAIDDVASALSFLRDPANGKLRIDPERIALVGHSMGGFLALQGGARDEGVTCIATMAAANFGDRATLANTTPEALEGFRRYSDQLIMLNGFNGGSAVAELLGAGEAFDNLQRAPKLVGKKLFLIAAERDQAVDISVHERHMDAFGAEPAIKLAEWVADDDHSFSAHRIELAERLIDWLNSECR